MAPITKLAFTKYGDPLSEISLVEDNLPDAVQPSQAHVRVLYSPVNPADLLSVHGIYPAKPPVPAVGGMEGLVEVIKGNKFQPGDRALILTPGWGFWRQEGIVDESSLVPVPKELAPEAAATLVINPLTAYFMLKSIVPLQAGDVVIQNAGNSAVGQFLIQMAKIWGFKTINIVRHRENLQETVDYLKGLGADAVITDEQLAKGLDHLKLDLPAPKLAIECVGGQTAAHLAATLADGGTMIVYGLLSGQAPQVSATDLIFRNIRVVGYWVANSLRSHSREEIGKVFQEVIGFYLSSKLQVPKFRKFPLLNWKEAIQHAARGFTNEKALLQLN